jgi:hypothetical protein
MLVIFEKSLREITYPDGRFEQVPESVLAGAFGADQVLDAVSRWALQSGYLNEDDEVAVAV